MSHEIKRPLWYAWLINGDAVLMQFKDDVAVLDKEGYFTCEYPIRVKETLVPVENIPGGHQVAFTAKPIAVTVNTAEVKLMVTGYVRCENDALIEMWEKVRQDTMSNFSRVIPAMNAGRR